jgi:hypothetical protein
MMVVIRVWDSKIGWKQKAASDQLFDLQMATEEWEGWKVIVLCCRVIVMFQQLKVRNPEHPE